MYHLCHRHYTANSKHLPHTKLLSSEWLVEPEYGAEVIPVGKAKHKVLTIDDATTNNLAFDSYVFACILLAVREIYRIAKIKILGGIEHQQVLYSFDTLGSELSSLTRRDANINQRHSICHQQSPSLSKLKPSSYLLVWMV